MFRRNGKASNEAATAARIAELTRSRRAVAEAYERERRRIERDLHDGAQQYLVAAAMALGEAQLSAEDTGADPLVRAELERAHGLIAEGLKALRRTVHGISPQVLADAGLVAALEAAAAAHGPHVTVRAPHPLPRIEPSVLAAAYFFTCEALTNCARHAAGAPVSVLVTADSVLSVSVVDRGPGGAAERPGGGLAEMRARLSAFDGDLELSSPPGGPTRLLARIPLLAERGRPLSIAQEAHRDR